VTRTNRPRAGRDALEFPFLAGVPFRRTRADGRLRQIITGSIGFDHWEWGVDLFYVGLLKT
jgi:hypothetical protein